MNTPKTTELPRRAGLSRLAVGALVAIGVALAAVSPAMADDDDDGWRGHKQWKKHHKHRNHYSQGYYYAPPPPVYYHYQPAPVYYAPPPPVYYYPAPVYRRPEINIVFPLDFD